MPPINVAICRSIPGSGYSRMAVGLSPIRAQDIEAAARRKGLRGIADFFTVSGTSGAVYGRREEAQFLTSVINAAPGSERVLRGLNAQAKKVGHKEERRLQRAAVK